mgnify:CR=1 FL=1
MPKGKKEHEFSKGPFLGICFLKQALELATVKQRVSAVLRRDPKKPVMVWGDQTVAYGAVVTLMTALQESGAPSVGLVTEEPAKP